MQYMVHQTGADGNGGPDLNFRIRGCVIHLLFQFAKQREDVLCIKKKLASGRRYIDFFGQPFKKPYIIMVLKFRDGLAYGWLRNIKLLCRRVHIKGFGHCNKDAEMAEGHGLLLSGD